MASNNENDTGNSLSTTPVVVNCLSNLHSINNKCDEVMEHVLDYNTDLVFLCELWLQSNTNSITAKIKDYN